MFDQKPVQISSRESTSATTVPTCTFFIAGTASPRNSALATRMKRTTRYMMVNAIRVRKTEP